MKNSHTINYGSRVIKFQLDRAGRRSLRIIVYPDFKIRVFAPLSISDSEVIKKVKAKASWIVKHLKEFESYHPLTPPRKFISGETHYYFGRQYRLKIEKGIENYVLLKGAFIHVLTKEDNPKYISGLLDEWYRERASVYFNEILAAKMPLFERYKISQPVLSIRKMNKRWGSCSPSGRITLNLELMKAPRASIEYVIAHELCHLVHRDHSAKFYSLQEKVMPDWKKWKDRLEKIMA